MSFHQLAVLLFALTACSRSSTDFCDPVSYPICPIGYACVDDRCEPADAGIDGGVTDARVLQRPLRHGRR